MSGANDQIPGPLAGIFTAISTTASNEWERRRLDTHPLAAQLHTYQNPEAISNFFERKRRISVNLVKTMRELMSWLDPTIHVLFMFSSTLGEGIGLVSNSSFPHDCSLSRTPRFRPLSPEKMVFIGHCNGNV
jgi:hypothetical protein